MSWNFLQCAAGMCTTKHIPAFGNPFTVSAGLRSEVLRKKVRESSQRFGAQQARSGTQTELGRTGANRKVFLSVQKHSFLETSIRSDLDPKLGGKKWLLRKQ